MAGGRGGVVGQSLWNKYGGTPSYLNLVKGGKRREAAVTIAQEKTVQRAEGGKFSTVIQGGSNVC